jgi:hypothetical protein
MTEAAVLESIEKTFGVEARQMAEQTGVVVDRGPLLQVRTPGLLRLIDDAQRRKFNRQLSPHVVKRLDFQGVHLVRRWLWHYHAEGEPVDRHERCQCWLKLRGKQKPLEPFLDFSSDLLTHWGKPVNPDLRGVRVGDVWISNDGVGPVDE